MTMITTTSVVLTERPICFVTALLQSSNNSLQPDIGVNAACLPPAGCQPALLRHRIADAHALGCDLLTSSAAFDTVSQHNLERAGLRIAYTPAYRLPLPS